MSSSKLTVSGNSVKIRMYFVNFGDCFLLAIRGTNKKTRYILIDCGVLLVKLKGEEWQEHKEQIRRVVEDIRKATDDHIDLLVITHEHQDHIEGFKLAEDVFDKIKIDNVWMGWTEKYNDPKVKEIDKKFAMYIHALKVTKKKYGAYNDGLSSMIGQALEFIEDCDAYESLLADSPLAANEQPKHTTMKAIQKRSKNDPEYCKPGGAPKKLYGFSGIRFYILGPPLDKEELMPHMSKAQEDAEIYITGPGSSRYDDMVRSLIKFSDPDFSFERENENFENDGNPFDFRYCFQKMSQIENNSSFPFYSQSYFNKEPWRKIDLDWQAMGSELAIKMKSHINNSSLVIAIENVQSGKILLFPGDAEVGNWLSWQNLEWDVDGKTVDITDLLHRTIFYKVGHHGSRNATLKEKGLLQMTNPDLTAMIPVDRDYAELVGWAHPWPDLLTALKDKCDDRVIRSDNTTSEYQQLPSSLRNKMNYKTGLYYQITLGM